jgi:oxaloacetate decarboxylase alpha subunit
LDLQELRELIQIFESANVAEIEVEEEGRRVVLKKREAIAPPPTTTYITAPEHHYAHQPQAAPPAAAPAQAPSQPEPAAEEPEAEDEGLTTIDAPMVGVFYAAPAPGEPVFVKPGDTVDANQTVCIVEAMKLMNEVATKFACTIEKVLVENAEPVEYGQPLFAVRPLEE